MSAWPAIEQRNGATWSTSRCSGRGAYNEGLAAVMFDQVEAWAGELKQLRADSAAKAA
jgi:hypothetical protein